MSFWLWLILAFFILSVELGISTYYLLWIAASAAVTSLVSIASTNVILQLIFFSLISVLSFLLSRKYVKEFRGKQLFLPPVTELLGKQGVVLSSALAYNLGTARVGTEVWSVRSEESLEVGDKIRVKDIESSILLVQKISEVQREDWEEKLQ